MPLFQLRCSECGVERRVLDFPPERVSHAYFDQEYASGGASDAVLRCSGFMERKPTGPSTSLKEVLDNGAMTRRVERFADAERLHKERALNSDEMSGGATRLDPREKS